MTKLRMILVAIALAASLFAVSAPAEAQGTKIVVVDQARVLRDSQAGQHIATEIERIENQMQQELAPTAQSLETLGESLRAKTANMTPEAMRADEALRTEAQTYQEKLVDLGQQRDQRATELALTERKASIAFSQALRPVLEEVMTETGAEIMMAAGDVMVALPSVDVTDQVISKLDASTPTISVTRERVPAQAQVPTQN